MRYANLSAAEEETHTPLALELREVACAAPAGELALRASADYLLAQIAALFESHPRLADLGYRPDTTDGQPTRIGLVKIAPPGHDGEYPQFDDVERADASNDWIQVLSAFDEEVLKRVFGAQAGKEARLTRAQAMDLDAALEERVRLSHQRRHRAPHRAPQLC